MENQNKLISAHSDLNTEKLDRKYFQTENENLDEKPYTKLGLNKGKSHKVEKKNEALDSNYIQLPEKKYQPFMGGSSSKTSILNKFKSSRETSQPSKETEKNYLQFYPKGTNISSPSNKKYKNTSRETPNYKSGSSAKKMCPKPIDQLMIHHSDTAVKPIIGNKDIEK